MASQFTEKPSKIILKFFLQIYANVENHYVLLKEYVIDIIMEIYYNFPIWVWYTSKDFSFINFKLDYLPSIGFVKSPSTNQVLNSNIRYESCTLQIYKGLWKETAAAVNYSLIDMAMWIMLLLICHGLSLAMKVKRLISKAERSNCRSYSWDHHPANCSWTMHFTNAQ